MKILVVSQYFYPETFRITDLVRELQAQQHEVVVLTGVPNYPHGTIYPGYKWYGARQENFDGARILRVPMMPRGRGGALRLILNYLSFVLGATIFGLPRLHREKFDACLVFATSPITAAIPANIFRTFTGCPVAIWIQDLWPEVVASVNMVKNPRLIALIGGLVKWIYRHSDLLLVQSESFRESVLRWGAREGQIRYLPNWAEAFYLPQNSSSPARAFRILFAGNLGRAQALDVVVDAIEILKKRGSQIEWHFIGEGVLKPWLEEQVSLRELSAQIKIFPRRPESEMPSTFSAYPVLLASLADDPILSLVLPSKIQSSMACAKPVLAAGGGELARVIRESACGLVSATQNAQALADNAEILSRAPGEELKQMGERGRAYYEKHFAREMLIQRTCDLLAEMQTLRKCKH